MAVKEMPNVPASPLTWFDPVCAPSVRLQAAGENVWLLEVWTQVAVKPMLFGPATTVTGRAVPPLVHVRAMVPLATAPVPSRPVTVIVSVGAVEVTVTTTLKLTVVQEVHPLVLRPTGTV